MGSVLKTSSSHAAGDLYSSDEEGGCCCCRGTHVPRLVIGFGDSFSSEEEFPRCTTAAATAARKSPSSLVEGRLIEMLAPGGDSSNAVT